MLGSSVLYAYSWAYAQTHANKIDDCKGFQWVLFVATVGYAYVSMGYPRVQVIDSLIYSLTYL